MSCEKINKAHLMLMCRSMACCWCSYSSIGYSETSDNPKWMALSSLFCCSSTSFRICFTLLRLLWSVWNMYLGKEFNKCEFIMASLCVCFKVLDFFSCTSVGGGVFCFSKASLFISSSESHETYFEVKIPLKKDHVRVFVKEFILRYHPGV